MKDRKIPLISDELRTIADRIDEVMNVVGGTDLPDDDWRWGLTVKIADEAGEVVGEIRPYGDGWLGFYPVSY